MSIINVSKKLYENEPTDSILTFNINGSNINNVIVNTLRRVITSKIPIYAFKNIMITKNDSIFNNNYLKLRLVNLPILGIKSKKSIFKKEDITDNNDEVNIENIADNINIEIDNNINSSSLDQLTMYLDVTNKTMNIISVTTDDAKFYLAGKIIDSPYKNKIQLLKLHPSQQIKMTCITNLNIEENNSVYSPVSVCFFNKINENNYDFTLESRGQLTEFEILEMCYDNIINDLDTFYNDIPDIDNMEGKISISGVDHTMGGIISEGLQNHKNVIFAGYSMPHPLDMTIVINYKLGKSKFKVILKEVIDKYKSTFLEINKKIKKLRT